MLITRLFRDAGADLFFRMMGIIDYSAREESALRNFCIIIRRFARFGEYMRWFDLLFLFFSFFSVARGRDMLIPGTDSA